jgi:hypothetical protein
MSKNTSSQKIHYALRVATACCFIGHGVFGVITKAVWCNYFELFGIGTVTAYNLMPLLGSFDILLGLTMLILPLRIIPAWLVFWGFTTGLCRPLAGEPLAELIERAGNFGAPLALLILSAGINRRNLFSTINPDSFVDQIALKKVFICLKITGFLLLAGHGWLNLLEKKSLLGQYISLGFANPSNIAVAIGLFEISAAIVVLIKPFRSLVLVLFIWKMSTELLYPHLEFFEWLERAGSYGVLLALWFTLDVSDKREFFHVCQIPDLEDEQHEQELFAV